MVRHKEFLIRLFESVQNEGFRLVKLDLQIPVASGNSVSIIYARSGSAAFLASIKLHYFNRRNAILLSENNFTKPQHSYIVTIH